MLNNLTKKELEVLKYISQGLSNQNIADKMKIRMATVISHIANIYFKLELTNGKGGDSSKRVKATLIYLREIEDGNKGNNRLLQW